MTQQRELHCKDAFRWRIVVAVLAATFGNNHARSDDWPQWRGPRRDAVSEEKGLLQSWPAGGPKVAWQASGLGTGYSSVVVGRGRLLTMGRKESDVVVTALDAVTGKPAWTRKIGETTRHPCSTPTLDGDHLYVLDPDGDLVCLKAATGEVVWQTSFIDQFSGRMMSGRGYGESPLIDGERLICTPGGADAALVALDKLTGNVVWKAKLPELGPLGKDGAGFSSVVVTEAAGLRQYVQLVGRGVIGVDARDGRFLWGYNAIANETANIPTPVVHNEFVFAANGYTAGSVQLKLVADNSLDGVPGVKTEVVYSLSGSQFQNHHGGVVRLGDFLFAGHGNNNGLPTCLEFKTGRVVWKRRGAEIAPGEFHTYRVVSQAGRMGKREGPADYCGGVATILVDVGGEPFQSGETFLQHLSLYHAECAIRGTGVSVRCFVSAAADVLVIEIDDQRDAPSPLQVRISMLREPEVRTGEHVARASSPTVLTERCWCNASRKGNTTTPRRSRRQSSASASVSRPRT